MNPKWGISTEIFRKPGFPRIDSALQKQNIEFFESEYSYSTNSYDPLPYHINECIVLYGPIKFVRQNAKGFIPGAFGFKSDTNCSHYMSNIKTEHFFNSDAIWLPFGSIFEKKELLQDFFGDNIFIRPDSGFKSFTGFSININDLETELHATKQLKNPGNQDLCLISKKKPILGEYRFVICDKKVVTGSQYRWDNKLDIRIDVHHECWEYAEKVAAFDWQLDLCYVVDIFLSEDGPKIGEFNSFASSGLYNCDMDKIVEAVNKAAIKEWEI